MMLSACSTKEAFSPQEPWTECEPDLFSFYKYKKPFYLEEMYLQTAAVFAKFLLAGDWNDFVSKETPHNVTM